MTQDMDFIAHFQRCCQLNDGYYRPEVTVTRDQMAVYVARAFELPM